MHRQLQFSFVVEGGHAKNRNKKQAKGVVGRGREGGGGGGGGRARNDLMMYKKREEAGFLEAVGGGGGACGQEARMGFFPSSK